MYSCRLLYNRMIETVQTNCPILFGRLRCNCRKTMPIKFAIISIGRLNLTIAFGMGINEFRSKTYEWHVRRLKTGVNWCERAHFNKYVGASTQWTLWIWRTRLFNPNSLSNKHNIFFLFAHTCNSFRNNVTFCLWSEPCWWMVYK